MALLTIQVFVHLYQHNLNCFLTRPPILSLSVFLEDIYKKLSLLLFHDFIIIITVLYKFLMHTCNWKDNTRTLTSSYNCEERLKSSRLEGLRKVPCQPQQWHMASAQPDF